MIYAEMFLLNSCWREGIHLSDECSNRPLKDSFLGYSTIELKVWVLTILLVTILTSDECIKVVYGGTVLQ